jgi:hypothetical protein
LAAQISQFSTHPQRKVIKSFSDQIGGDVGAGVGQRR